MTAYLQGICCTRLLFNGKGIKLDHTVLSHRSNNLKGRRSNAPVAPNGKFTRARCRMTGASGWCVLAATNLDVPPRVLVLISNIEFSHFNL